MQLNFSRRVVAALGMTLMCMSHVSHAQSEDSQPGSADLTYPAPGQSAPLIRPASGEFNSGQNVATTPDPSQGHLIIDGQFRQRYATPKVDSVDMQAEGNDATAPVNAVTTPQTSDEVVTPPAAGDQPLGFNLPGTNAEGAATRGTSALLWRILKAGVADSYLFGTIHSSDPRVLELPQPVSDALQQASVFVPEADISSDAIAGIRANMLFSDGQDLKSIVGTELFSSVAAKLSGLGITSTGAAKLKPWAAIMMLSTPPGHSGNFLDAVLQQEARSLGQRIEPLESIDEQLDVFRELSRDQQVKMLKSSVDNFEKLPGMIEELTVAWLDRDLDRLEQIGASHRDAEPDADNSFYERLINNRNKTMHTRLLRMLAEPGANEQSHFVAVGALHLPGELGLIRLLEQAGYKLSPIY